MTDNKQKWAYKLAKELKRRDNPKEFKPLEAIVINLNPVTVTALNGQITLVQGKNLVLSEWWQFRRDIDKEKALSEDIPELLEEIDDLVNGVLPSGFIEIIDPLNENLGVIHSFDPSTPPKDRHNIEVRQGFRKLQQIFEKVCEAVEINANELLALKLDLQVGDKVIIVPGAVTDQFFLLDKAL